MSREIDSASKHLAHLYVFSAVIGALENGTVSGPATTDSNRIIKTAKAAMQKCLKRYESAARKLEQQP